MDGSIYMKCETREKIYQAKQSCDLGTSKTFARNAKQTTYTNEQENIENQMQVWYKRLTRTNVPSDTATILFSFFQMFCPYSV